MYGSDGAPSESLSLRYFRNMIRNEKRYDSIGSAPVRKARAQPRDWAGALSIGAFERGRSRLGQTPAIMEFESIFHWKSLTTGLFCEHSKYGASLKRLPLLNRERNRSQREPERASTNEHA